MSDDKILDMLPLISNPEPGFAPTEPDPESEFTPAERRLVDSDINLNTSASSKPNITIPQELAGLARVLPSDARNVFARIKPSSWMFELWVQDPDADLNENLEADDDLAGMIKPFPRKMPICHAQPDLLSWLQSNDHVGPAAIEFSERNSTRKPEQLFLHIPKQQRVRDTEQAVSNSQHDLGALRTQALGMGAEPLGPRTQALGLVQQMMIQMQQTQSENMRMMAEVVRESRKDTAEMLAAVVGRIEKIQDTTNQINPMTELGERIHAQALQGVTEKIVDMSQGGIAGVRRVIETGRAAQDELAKMVPEREEKDEDWEFVKDLGKDMIRSKVLGDNAVNPQEDKLSTMLEQLGSQGNDILNEVR